jgi:predicted RNA-binding Zn-ribbon protein involved in translation (DUF1610 family)
MAVCGRCNKHYREPEDEQGDHECPKCGWYWMDENDDEDGWHS